MKLCLTILLIVAVFHDECSMMMRANINHRGFSQSRLSPFRLWHHDNSSDIINEARNQTRNKAEVNDSDYNGGTSQDCSSKKWPMDRQICAELLYLKRQPKDWNKDKDGNINTNMGDVETLESVTNGKDHLGREENWKKYRLNHFTWTILNKCKTCAQKRGNNRRRNRVPYRKSTN